MHQDYIYFFSLQTLLIFFYKIFPNFKLDGTEKALKCNYVYYVRYKTLLSLNIELQTETLGNCTLCIYGHVFSSCLGN